MVGELGKKLRWGLLTLAGAAAISSAVLLSNKTPSGNPYAKAHPAQASLGVTAESSGKLLKWMVVDGAEVHKGDLVATLDTSEKEAELARLEAEMNSLQKEGANAIMPFDPALAGSVPLGPPSGKQVVRIPVTISGKLPAEPQSAPAQIATSNPKENEVGEAEHQLEAARVALAKLEDSLKSKTRDLGDIQNKVAEAQTLAKGTSEKASNAQALLEQGVISAQRAKEIEADDDHASRVLAGLLVEQESLKREIALMTSSRDTSSSKLPEAEKALAAAKLGASKEPVSRTAAKPLAKAVKAASEIKYIYKSIPSAQLEEPSAEPVQLFVDKGELKSVEGKRKALQAQIDALRTEIAAAKIYASGDGTIHLHKALNEVISKGAVVATID